MSAQETVIIANCVEKCVGSVVTAAVVCTFLVCLSCVITRFFREAE